MTHGTGGIMINDAGAVLPNRARTPGAVNPSVSQANIGQTVCMSGWTSTIRPTSSVTTRLKVEQLASGYTFKGDTTPGDYEEDQLISLSLGGEPSAEANLWPEPFNTPEGARVKDVVENKLHALICDHAVTLATAQRAIATNWWIAYQTYVGVAPTSSTYKPAPVPAPAPALVPAPSPTPTPAPIPTPTPTPTPKPTPTPTPPPKPTPTPTSTSTSTSTSTPGNGATAL